MTRYFTEDHEWIDVDGDSATVGITDYAQSQLGDIVFAEVPATGATLNHLTAPPRVCITVKFSPPKVNFSPRLGT